MKGRGVTGDILWVEPPPPIIRRKKNKTIKITLDGSAFHVFVNGEHRTNLCSLKIGTVRNAIKKAGLEMPKTIKVL